MKLIILFAVALVAVVVAAPAEPDPINILRSNFDTNSQGGYNFGFETENGIIRDETGELKQVLDEENKPHDVVVVRGKFEYINSEGKQEAISYYADETGYHADGESIPKPASRR